LKKGDENAANNSPPPVQEKSRRTGKLADFFGIKSGEKEMTVMQNIVRKDPTHHDLAPFKVLYLFFSLTFFFLIRCCFSIFAL